MSKLTFSLLLISIASIQTANAATEPVIVAQAPGNVIVDQNSVRMPGVHVDGNKVHVGNVKVDSDDEEDEVKQKKSKSSSRKVSVNNQSVRVEDGGEASSARKVKKSVKRSGDKQSVRVAKKRSQTQINAQASEGSVIVNQSSSRAAASHVNVGDKVIVKDGNVNVGDKVIVKDGNVQVK